MRLFSYVLFATVACYAYMLRLVSNNEGLMNTLDVSAWSGERDAYRLLTKQGEEGRVAYAALNRVDFAFALLYGYVLCTLVYRADVSRIFIVVPLSALCGDLFENLSIYHLLRAYPALESAPKWCASYGPFMTKLKWLGISLTLILLICSTLLRTTRQVPSSGKTKAS